MLKNVWVGIATVGKLIKTLLKVAFSVAFFVFVTLFILGAVHGAADWAGRNHKPLDTPGQWVDAAIASLEEERQRDAPAPPLSDSEKVRTASKTEATPTDGAAAPNGSIVVTLTSVESPADERCDIKADVINNTPNHVNELRAEIATIVDADMRDLRADAKYSFTFSAASTCAATISKVFSSPNFANIEICNVVGVREGDCLRMISFNSRIQVQSGAEADAVGAQKRQLERDRELAQERAVERADLVASCQRAENIRSDCVSRFSGLYQRLCISENLAVPAGCICNPGCHAK
jgi:hypothetical protein